MLERRQGDKYRETKDTMRSHNAGALFEEFLKRMDERLSSAPQGYRHHTG